MDDVKKDKDIIVLPDGTKVNRKTWLTSGLRRMSYRWRPRNEAERQARVDRGLYKCAYCEQSFRNGQYAIDHIIPIINVKTGWTNWDDFLEKLFCDVDGFQILCHACHENKTSTEDLLRTHYNQQRKEDEKPLTKRKKRSKVIKDE